MFVKLTDSNTDWPIILNADKILKVSITDEGDFTLLLMENNKLVKVKEDIDVVLDLIS